MFSQSWWKKYSLLAKVYLILIFCLLLNVQNLLLSLREVGMSQSQLATAKYDSYLQGPVTGQYIPNTPEYDDWQKRRNSVEADIKQILVEIEAKGEDYSRVDYFRNLERVMQLEDKYKMQLMGGTMMPFEAVIRASNEALRKEMPLTPEQATFIQKVQDTHALRNGDSPTRPVGSIDWFAVLSWLATKYFWLMLFWASIYLVRFLERKTSIRLFQRHYSELHKFIDDREAFPGKLSLKDELLLCPERFIGRIVFWPLYCWHYPHHESPASLVRYLGLKTHFLKYKPFGYQLSDQEDVQLHWRARVRVKNFDQAVKELFSFDTGTLVKKSLLTAQLSLICGVLFQPAISLAATYSEKVEQHFYSSVQIQLIQNIQPTQDNVGIGPPDDNHGSAGEWLILESGSDLVIPPGLSSLVVDLVRKKMPGIVLDIEHIPLNRLFAGERVS